MQIDGGVTVSFGCTAVVLCHDQVQSQVYWPHHKIAQALLRLTMFADGFLTQCWQACRLSSL